MTRTARRGASIGLAVGLVAGAALLGACVGANRYFADSSLLSLLLFGVLPGALAAALGALAGGLAGRWSKGSGPGREAWFPARVLVALAALALAALSSSASWLPRPDWHARTLLYGVDGATWAVLDPMFKAGTVPALQGVASRGARAVLTSQEPVISPVVWTNIGTGYRRDDHGISGFHTRSDEVKKPRVWDYLAARGDVVGTYKFLVTWPPQRLRGFQVPAWLAQGPETTPEDLGFVKRFEMGNRRKQDRKGQDGSSVRAQWEFVRQGIPHGLRLSTLARAVGFILEGKVRRITEDEAFYEMNLVRAAIDRDVFVALMDRFDPAFATFTYYATDSLAHRYWKYYEPEGFEGVSPAGIERFGDAIPSAYRQADSILAEILGRLPRDTNVVVVSDHGFVSAAAPAGGGHFVFGLTTTGISGLLSERGAKVDVSRVGQKLSVGVRDDSPLDGTAIQAALARLTYQGQPFVKTDVLAASPAGVPSQLGLSLAVLDDLRAALADGARVDVDGTPGPTLAEMVSTADHQSGVHHLDGVALVQGLNVQRSADLVRGVTLTDVAPTILALSCIEPAPGMPGRVMPFVSPCPRRQAPDVEGAWAHARTHVQVEASAAGKSATEDMLKALGYVDEGRPPPAPPSTPPAGSP